MPAGRHLEKVYEFGAQERISLSPEVIMRAVQGAQETEDTCREGGTPGLPQASAPLLAPDTPPGSGDDRGGYLPPDDNMNDPLLDARVLSVHRNSAGDRQGEFRNAVSELVQSPWAGWLVSRLRTFLWCCKFTSEHALHPLAHHSRFVQLSGLLPTDPAAQERALLCRAMELGLTFEQLQGAELSCFELLARRQQMLEMKLRD